MLNKDYSAKACILRAWAVQVPVFGTLACHVSKSSNFLELAFHSFSNQWNFNLEPK